MNRLVLSFICILIWSSSCTIYKQNIAIEFVTLTNEEDTVFSIKSPIAIDLTGKNQLVADKINAEILRQFGISDFNENQSYEFRWGEVNTTHEIDKEVLHMHISSSYYGGNYPNDYEDDLYFNINTGDPIEYRQIPIKGLFTSTGYSEFLDKYWIPGAKIKLDSATLCAGSEPLCTYYDITDYTVNSKELTLSLTSYCFARVAQFCSPVYDVSVALELVEPYLNDSGKAILSEPDNFSKDPIVKIRANQKLYDNITLKD